MRQGLQYQIDAVMPQAVATGLFVSLCTIQAPTGALGPSGAPTGAYSDVPGLVGLICMDAPENQGLSVNEQRTVQQIASAAMRHVLLDRYYSDLSPATNWGDLGWRAVVDGVVYDLAGAEADSQLTQTRLRLQKVTT